jgi:UDP-GlcNAc:undecaprenyl-phosphate/decaprenyl-phosphate GlcNAc-1-phosphate transferase
MMSLAVLYALALAAALALVPLCRIIAVRFGYVASPKADRWHRRRTALFGGIASAAGTLGGAALGGLAPALPAMVAGGTAVFLLGLCDDLVGLMPATKLVVEVVIAAVFVFFGYRLHWVESLTLDAMLTLFWIVGITNAFNLLDNMDGLCAGIGVIVAAALLAASVEKADMASARYLVLMMGALSGFLVYNVNPASIFMGDSGSLFIGLTLSALALSPVAGPRADSGVISAIGAPVLLLLVPIFDTTLVTVLRLISGRRPSQGGKDHSSHRLVTIGLPERTAVMVLWALAAVGAIIGVRLHRSGGGLSAAGAAAFVLAMLIFSAYLGQVRVYDRADPVLLRSGRITPFVTEWLHKRRAAEVLLDASLVPLCYYVAYRVRFEGPEYAVYFPQFLTSLPVVLAVQMVALFAVGAYRGVWRYFGLMDAVIFARAVAAGTIVAVAALAFLYRLENYSRGVFIIYAAIALLALTGSRASFRLISEFVQRRRAGERLLVYGAGDAGALVVRELLRNTQRPCRMLGFIDDDPAKQSRSVHGYAVLGGYDRLVSLAESRAVDRIVISARVIDGEKLRCVERLCAENDISLSRLHIRLEHLISP